MHLDQTIYVHEKFTEQDVHWCSESEEYAAGNHLITALRSGWSLAAPRVEAKQVWRNRSRPLTVYHFLLARNHQTMLMPVLSNPYVERYIIQNQIAVVYDGGCDYFVVPESRVESP